VSTLAKVLTKVDLLDFLVTYEARIALLRVERMDSAAAAASPGLQYLRHLPCEIMLCLAGVLGPVGIAAKIAVLHHHNTTTMHWILRSFRFSQTALAYMKPTTG
jgi:hypothetical protein